MTATSPDLYGTAVPADAPAAVEVRRVGVHYGIRPALHHVDLAVRPGEVVGILGPNGAGKSTLVKAILGLVPVTVGTISVFGRPIGEMRAEAAYVPQQSQIDWAFPAVVRDVVTMGRVPRSGVWRSPDREARSLIETTMARLGLAAVAGRQIGELSGGQQQRVFLARAIVQQPRLYLLDEPLAGVDAATEALLWREFAAAAAEGAGVVVVHHDLNTVDRFDRVAVIAGRIVADGPPATVLTDRVLRETYRGATSASASRHRGGAWC